jgi:FixJ family two-component response regulator
VTESAKICIVDDDAEVRSGLQSFLRSAGLEVYTFPSAEAFLDSSDRSTTDCLITDLHMPGIDGLALQEILNRQGRAFPVIVLTAFPTPEAEKRSSTLGASAFLSKPIDLDLLLQRVESIVC